MAKTRLELYEKEKQNPILYSFSKKEKNTE